MLLRVLGCHGGESPRHRATSFLIDGALLLDAGSVTRGLSVEEQLLVDAVFVSHAHLDHVRDLGLLVDNIFARRNNPIEVYCSDSTARGLEDSYFNGTLWPDFLKIPNPQDPDGNGMLRLNRIEPGTSFQANGLTLNTVTVNHSIECQACFITDDTGGTLVYCGDTGPTDALWEAINKVEDLRGLIVEVSFPNAMVELAKVSGHLTAELMASELDKLNARSADVPIYLYGLKPGYYDVVAQEIADLDDDRLTVLKPMDEYTL